MVFDMPVFYYRDARLAIVSPPGSDNRIEINAPTGAAPGMPALTSDTTGNWTLIFDFYAANDYFYFMEGLIWVFIIQHCCFAGRPMQRLIFTNTHWNNPHLDRLQARLLAILYRGVDIVDHGDGREFNVQHLVHMDRTLSKTRINKFLDQALPVGRPFVMQMCDQVRAAVGAAPPTRSTGRRPRALYVKTSAPGGLGASAERGLLALLGHTFDVAIVDVAALAWEDQVRATAKADVLLGVHGKALTNLLWLQPGAVVLDIMPPGFRQYDYQLLCELSGISYFGLEGELVHRDHGRDGPCRGTSVEGDKTIETLDWPAVNDCLAAICSLLGVFA